MITSKLLLLSVSVVAILVFSTVLVAIPITPRASAQQKVPGADWKRHNGDGVASNFSPQTQITKANVNFLQLDWMFAFPSAPPSARIGGYAGADGATTGGLIKDGIYLSLIHI